VVGIKILKKMVNEKIQVFKK